MRFRIRLEIERRYRYYDVEKISDDGRLECYRIFGKNKSIVLQSNRPLLRNKGLKYKLVEWKVIDGSIPFSKIAELFIDAIMKEVDK